MIIAKRIKQNGVAERKNEEGKEEKDSLGMNRLKVVEMNKSAKKKIETLQESICIEIIILVLSIL